MVGSERVSGHLRLASSKCLFMSEASGGGGRQPTAMDDLYFMVFTASRAFICPQVVMEK